MLKLKVNCTENLEKFNENKNLVDIINGKILKDNSKVAFIKCFHYGMEHINDGENEYTYSIYKIDRLLLGLNLTNMEIENFNACKVVYDNIDDFFDKSSFDIDWISGKVQFIPFGKMYKYNNGKLVFETVSVIEENIDEHFVKLNKKIVVKLECDNKVNFSEIINNKCK